MMNKMTNVFVCALILLLATCLPLGSSFVARPLSPAPRLVAVPTLPDNNNPKKKANNNNKQQQQQPTTSTTLYYRDDVPPIGSSSTWETPNDFDQFLTQCSIQSFLFLLDSLRDDQTLKWLNDFTAPVVLQQQQQQSSNSTTAVSTAPPKTTKRPKVSLEQAARSAVTNTDQLMARAIAEGRKKKKTTTKKAVEKKKTPTFRNKKTKSKKTKSHKKKKTSSSSTLSLASMTLLDERASSQAAFAAYAKMMELLCQDDPEEDECPVTNTDISALYAPPFSGIPRKQPGSTGPKNSYAPFESKKTISAATPKFARTPNNTPKESVHSKKPALPSLSVPDTPQKPMEAAPTDAVVAAAQDKDILKYHGLAMLNCTRFPTWDAYFETLLIQPKEYYTIESPHPNLPSYDLDIEPTSLCSRMLSVRTQIAAEFEHDLDVIANMGGTYVITKGPAGI